MGNSMKYSSLVAVLFLVITVMFVYKQKTYEHKYKDRPEPAIAPSQDAVKSVFSGDASDSIEVSFNELMTGPYTLPDDHPQLIKFIQQSLHPPSEKSFSLSHSDWKDPSKGQSIEVLNILGDMKNKGFFVECGAYDGVHESNTWLLEKKYGWSGLLVEANPNLHNNLMQKHRRSWSINACLSLKPCPNKVVFQTNSVFGKITNKTLNSATAKDFATVQCVPFYSILLALNIPTIDFFSLDVEGFELDVLKTIPWDKVDIRVLSVEFINIKAGKNILGRYVESDPSNIIAGKNALRHYMESIGYVVYKEAGAKFAGLKSDFIFYRKDIIPLKPAY